jgi:hypothetical protein
VKKRLLVSRPNSPVFQTSLVAALIGFGLYFDHEAASAPSAQTLAQLRAQLASERAAPEVQQVAVWAVDSSDPAGLPFVVVDKARARLFAFDPQGHLQGSAPVLLGASQENGQENGRGSSAAMLAGRFVADPRRSARSDGIVWVRAGVVLSLNVPTDFYRAHLSRLRTQESVAYVLPEAAPWQQVFGARQPYGGTQISFAQSAPRSPL